MKISKIRQQQEVTNRFGCDKCPFFKNEDMNGDGICDLLESRTRCDSVCDYVYCYEFMNYERALKVLHLHQKWRRGSHGKMIPPVVVGYAMDEAIRCLRKAVRDGEKENI